MKDTCIGDKRWVSPDTDWCGLGLPPKRLSLSLDIVTRCDIGWCYRWQLLLENLGDLRWVPPGVGVYSGMLGKLECSPLVLVVHTECSSPEWKCVALVEYIKLGKALSSGCLMWLLSLHAAAIWMVYAVLMGKCSKDWVAQPHPPSN